MQGAGALDVVLGLGGHAVEIESGAAQAAGAGVVGRQQQRAFVGFPFRLAGEDGFLEEGEIGDADAAVQVGLERAVEGEGTAEKPGGHVAPGAGLDLHQAAFAVPADHAGVAAGLDLDDGVHEAGGILFGIQGGVGGPGRGLGDRETIQAGSFRRGPESSRAQRQQEGRAENEPARDGAFPVHR